MSISTGPSWGGNRMRNALMLTALIELAVGAVVLFAALASGDTGGALIAAIILGVVGLLLLGWARRVGRSQAQARRIRASGLPGSAKIESVTQTGVVLNEVNPQVELELEVHLDGRDPYMIRQKEFVPGALLGMLTAGRPLPVRVDPSDLSKVVILWEGGGMAAAEALDPASLHKGVQELRAKIRENPLPATALLRKVEDSGTTIGDYRLMQVEAEIRVDDGRPPYVREAPTAVPVSVADRVRPGVTIPARIRRDDPDLVAIEWEQAPLP